MIPTQPIGQVSNFWSTFATFSGLEAMVGKKQFIYPKKFETERH